jgi:hypothetical protein
LNNIAIPKYQAENETHRLLSEKSQECHIAVSEGHTESIAVLEAEIDEAAANMWGITANELKAIHNASQKQMVPIEE